MQLMITFSANGFLDLKLKL